MTASPASRRTLILRIVLTVLVLGGGVGAVSTLYRMDWTTFGTALANVSPLLLAVALAVSTLQVFFQLARFVVILPRAERSPMGELLDATAVGQIINYTTPLRSGDAYKLLRLSPDREAQKGRLATLLAALVVERVADVLALLLVTAWVSVSQLGRWGISLRATKWTATNVAFVATLAGVAAVVLAGRTPKFLVRFVGDAWAAMSSPRFARCIVVAVLTWILDAGTLWWTSRSGGCAISFRGAMQSVFVLNLGIAMPVTFGNLGVFEASLGFALSQQGIPAGRALAIATVEHFVKFAGLGLCLGILRIGRASSARGAQDALVPDEPRPP
jgi:uncharacterized membrane protein YbhN (UPF0104 family)